MGIEHEARTVSSSDRQELADEMARFAEGADGRRWMNIVPDVDPDTVATGSLLGRFFSGRGPVIPTLTWFPEYWQRGSHQPTQLGVAHAAGKDAVGRLGERGVVAPTDWVLVQDQQRSGFIFAVPPGASYDKIVGYGLAALPVLSPFDFADRFRVTFSRS